MAQNLTTVRAKVDDLRQQIAATRAAIPPAEQLRTKVRQHLEQLANDALDRLVDRMADVLAFNASTFDVTPPPAVAPFHALGLALAGVGPDSLLEQAEKLAAERDNGALRLTDSEKADRLDELSRRLYTLELQEVELSADDLRTGISGAALLQIPLEVAADCGLIGGDK